MDKLLALSDQAALVYLSDEESAWRFASAARSANWPWLVDVVQAYASVAIFFDLDQVAFAEVAAQVQSLDAALPDHSWPVKTRLLHVPCCYDLGLDMERIGDWTGLAADDIIDLHLRTVYTVYAIGFCPGFPYLGYLPEKLCGVPRLESPRLRVAAGSVGLTGRQTGIYTEARPGGWNILGRTPLELVNMHDGYFPLRTGDRVQFTRVDAREFSRLEGQRL